jgi:CheY-like chemotaxis protein
MRGIQISDGHEANSVLIVNDLPEQLMLMDGLLRKAGYCVLTAEDGPEAFKGACSFFCFFPKEP